ncbi:hypothetical protein Angca_009289, partial [Angiostrongylus cantonensis]
MLIPVCCDRLPVRLEVAVIAATGLPVMNKSINCTDAFVEVRFADEIHKTDVVTSLNPQWDSDLFPFDTDEKQLSENTLILRVMDHDTYSANDAIGRVNLDVNIIVEKMRMQELERIDEAHTLPIYDTLNGNRGELIFRVKLHLLVDMDWKNYVQILSGYQVPFDYRVVEIVGLVHHLKCEKDPDYEWLDRIRTPRATNEARQSAMRDALKNAGVSLAHKVHKYQCSLICGYREYLDTEGSSTDLFTVRVLGTALRIEKGKDADIWSERVHFPILTINEVPRNRQCGTGAIVAVRAVHILEDDDDDPELTRKRWWNDLRAECHQQAVAVDCNLIIGYSEQFTVNDGIALIGCSGTAVVMGRKEEANVFGWDSSFCQAANEKKSKVFQMNSVERREVQADSHVRHSFMCSQFHTPLQAGRTPFNVTTHACSSCRYAVTLSISLEVIECISGLYNGSRWPTDVFSQCCYPPRQVWYQFADPGGMKGLVGHERWDRFHVHVAVAPPTTAPHAPYDIYKMYIHAYIIGSVTDFLICTTSCPPPHYLIGPKSFIQVSVTKKLSTTPSEAEEYATEVSNVLPFIDHDLYNSLICEAKSLNPNANVIFDVHCTYSMSDSILVCVVTGVLVRLICMSRDVSLSPSLSKVHSLTNLQQANDAKRFSWGTVREAIRFKPSATSSITLKILNLKPPRLDFGEDSASRNRLHLNTFVGKIRRRQHEKQYVSHVVFDRHLSTSIGLLDPATACNSAAIAGMHLSPSLRNSLLIKEGNQQARILTRWSDVFIREDLTNTVKDSQSVDSFVTNVLDERISMARCVAAMGNLAQENTNGRSFGSALSNFRIATPQFSVSKEHAHMIVLMSCD